MNKDKKKPDLRAEKRVKINSLIFALQRQKTYAKD
jgi:hypothetical protein